MPTSSQAKILKCDDGHDSGTNYRCLRPTRYPLDYDKSRSLKPFIDDSNKEESPRKQTCELVRFDFNVITQKPSIDGVEGVFAYDRKTNSYGWQIRSVSPKRPYDGRNPSGDNPVNNPKYGSSDEEGYEVQDSYIQEQTSETRHFTTPAVSLLDTSNNRHHNNPRTGLHKERRRLHRLRNTETVDGYGNLEDIAVRSKATYSPDGTLVKERNNLRSPKKCVSDVSNSLPKSVPKLSITNLDLEKVPPSFVIPYKRQGFIKPSPKEEQKKASARSVKKSLLEEVKKSVRWDQRISPTTNFRRGPVTADPNAICFSLRKTLDFAHSDVKELIEFNFKTKVKAVQYDPVSVRMSNPDMSDRWVVTLTSRADCVKVIQQGMAMDGDIVVIRFWDAVLQEEKQFYATCSCGKFWNYPCRAKLQQEKHNQVLRNFLAVH